jgi:hypothetical protein
VKKLLAILGACALVALAVPLLSQNPRSTSVRGIYGRWDPNTGIFTPVHEAPARLPEGEELPPTTTYTGKIVVNFTLTITSAIPTTDTIACNVSADVVDATGSITDSLSTSATRSGSTATCSVTIPYSWNITTTADDVYITYDISAPPQPLVSTSAFPRRYSGRPVATITVPANGATTTYNLTDTL